jgi:hypothetical protein
MDIEREGKIERCCDPWCINTLKAKTKDGIATEGVVSPTASIDHDCRYTEERGGKRSAPLLDLRPRHRTKNSNHVWPALRPRVGRFSVGSW